ncbi:MAG: fumarylacetoacetate hydrolase family protein [Verrucomicrobia bacterium]|nr:fumarylacetoacetate hydrolase family protein [Verrucomicrobiota bacterium]
MIRVYSSARGLILESNGAYYSPPGHLSLDTLFRAAAPGDLLRGCLVTATPASAPRELRAPLQSQEVWAAGVTYLRSKSARMAESKDAGGGTFYDRVYEADRPELFFKATPHRVAAPGALVRIRSDSRWNVPEPELTLAVNAAGRIFGYTLGNDMSSRDIEGENPLYLPQAKVYDRSAALGPCLVVSEILPGPETALRIEIRRGGAPVFQGETTLGQIKRPLPSLADWLFRDNSFPSGAYLMTGTGIVPPDTFTLQRGDEIRITLEPVGTLQNTVG